jgi:hypothetical protein
MSSLAACRLTESFPDREKYGLARRMRRADASVPADIAEAFGFRPRLLTSCFHIPKGYQSEALARLAPRAWKRLPLRPDGSVEPRQVE